MHLRWYTKREWASNPFFISSRQRRSSVSGAFTSCRSDFSWGTISNSCASCFSLSYLISHATPSNSASLRSPFCARCYRNKICVMSLYLDESSGWQCLVKLERYQKHPGVHTSFIIMHALLMYHNSRNVQTNTYNTYTNNKPLEYWVFSASAVFPWWDCNDDVLYSRHLNLYRHYVE